MKKTDNIKNYSNISTKSNNINESAIYEISLNFKNNLFQTFLFEIFERLKINLIPTDIRCEDFLFENTIKCTYNNETQFLIFIDKNIFKDWIKSIPNISNMQQPAYLFALCEKINSITSCSNSTIIFNEIPNNLILSNHDRVSYTKEDMILFLNFELKIKVYDCTNKNDLVDYITNYTESLLNRKEKSKITFFDSKPVSNTNLCEIENIIAPQSIMFVKHLMCITGISERKAIAVVKNYPTLKNLMSLYDSCELNESEKENLLTGVEIIDKSKNSAKKLGIAISTKIYKCFTSSDPTKVIN